MSTPKHKGTLVKLFVPSSDYEAWMGLAKQSGVSVPTAIYSVARVAFQELVQKERERLVAEKEKEAANATTADNPS